MSLAPHKITALEGLFADSQASGKNTVASAVVIMYDSNNTAITLYDDEAFSNPSTAKTTDANGELIVWVTAGEYTQSVNGSAKKPITVGSASPTEVDTFANLQLLQPRNEGQSFICQERANAKYILQPSGYVAESGDALFPNGRAGKLIRETLVRQNGANVSAIQQSGFTQVALIGDSLSDEVHGPLTQLRNSFYSEFGYGGQYWAFLDGSPGFSTSGFTRPPTTAELSYSPDLRARADDNFTASAFASILNDDADYDSVRVYYLEQPLGCSFAVGPTSLGASGRVTLVDTLSTTTQVNYVDVPKAAGGGGAITIKSTVEGKICLFGVELLKDNQNTYGGRVTRMAKDGAQAAEIAALNATQYTQWLTWFNPDVVFINLGMNDRNIKSAVSILTDIQTINARIPVGIKRIFISPNQPADDLSSALLEYRPLLKAWAESNHYGYIDNTNMLGSYNHAVEQLLMSDTVHPSDSGKTLITGNYLNYIGLPASANAKQPPVYEYIGGSELNFTGALTEINNVNLAVNVPTLIYKLGLNKPFLDAMIEIRIYSNDQGSSLISTSRFALKNATTTSNYVTVITPIITTDDYKYTSTPGTNEIIHTVTAAIVSDLAEITFEITSGNLGGYIHVEGSYISPNAVVIGGGVIENTL